MQMFEKIMMGMLLLVFAYVVLANGQESSNVISSLGSTAGGLFGTLQGRSVQFGSGSIGGTGVSVSGGTTGF